MSVSCMWIQTYVRIRWMCGYLAPPCALCAYPQGCPVLKPRVFDSLV